METVGQKPDPTKVPDPGQAKPDSTKPKRPPSTVGEIFMAIFVAATVVIYVILTCITLKTLHVDNRPWIYGQRFHLIEEPQENRPVTVRVWVSNAGKTPGMDVRLTTQLFMANHEPPAPDYTHLGEGEPRGVIWPSQQEVSFDATPSTFKSVPAYNAGDGAIYLHAKISYRDLFGGKHWTIICILHYHGTPLDAFGYCEHNNDADREE